MGESHLMWHHFPRVDHLKIESQRLDLKPIYNKTTPAKKEIRARRKKKQRRRNKPRLARPWSSGLGCASLAAWAVRPRLARPGSRNPGRVAWIVQPRSRGLGRTTQVARPGSREPQVARPGRARTISFSPSLI